MTDLNFHEIEYKHFGHCMQVDNGLVDIVVTLDIGPRIIRFGALDQENVFCDDAPLKIERGNEEWRLYGGHRLWHSPEVFPRTYDPDNLPVKWNKMPTGIQVKRPLESWVQIEKEMIISVSPDAKKVTVDHILTNRNAWPVELAAWGISVMAANGKEIIPLPQHQTHFSEGNKGLRIITLWSYTKMNDPRVYWGDKYITLQQDPQIESPIKFGLSNEDGWAAYFNDGNLFIKRYNHHHGAKYPDHGVSLETFAIDFMLEIESLSPLVLLQPNDEVRHTEEWELIEGITTPANKEDELDAVAQKYIIG